jgi:hypothetical protein
MYPVTFYSHVGRDTLGLSEYVMSEGTSVPVTIRGIH